MSPFGKVVEAILNPTPDGIQRVQETVSGDANAMIERIRDLLGEEDLRSSPIQDRRTGQGRK